MCGSMAARVPVILTLMVANGILKMFVYEFLLCYIYDKLEMSQDSMSLSPVFD